MAALSNHAKDRAIERFNADERGICTIGARLGDPASYRIVDDPNADGEVRMIDYKGRKVCGVIRDDVVTTILPENNYSIVRARETMTVKDICEATGAPKQTVIDHINRIYPGRVRHGVRTHLTEAEVSEISKSLKSSHNVKSTDTRTLAITRLEKMETIYTAMRYLSEEVEALKAENAELTEDATVARKIAKSNGLILPMNAGKIIGRKPKLFLAQLVTEGVLYRRSGSLVPKQEYQNRGYFQVKESFDEINNRTWIQMYVTPKGLDWLAKKYGSASCPPSK